MTEATTDLFCAECGGLDGCIQHVDIAWPGKEPYYVYDEALFPEPDWVSNPQADGRHLTLWLHAECEAEAIKRLEEQKL